MAELTSTHGNVHRAIVEDVHQMGKVLSRNFRLINTAYGILLAGLLATAIAFAFGI